MIILGVIGAGLLILSAWFILTYNSLVSLSHQALNAFKQIDVQLKRRHDLIPNLVSTVKGYMKFEADTLERVIAARQQALSVPPGALKELAQKEGLLSQALGRLMAVVEQYPDLKADANVRRLMEELTTTENQLGFARQFYNDLATRLNIAQQSFPSMYVAQAMGLTLAELFELPAGAAEREVPKVDLQG